MNSRAELHEFLCDILGSRNVYFNPPEGMKMNYPAIKYSLNDIPTFKADGTTFIKKHQYQIVVIDKDPDSEIAEKILDYGTAGFSRRYMADNLVHDALTLYY